MRSPDDIREIRDGLQYCLIAAHEYGEPFEDNEGYQTIKCTLDWVLGEGSATQSFGDLMEHLREKFRQLPYLQRTKDRVQ